MDEISVKGKKYLKAKLVARELGYTNDYIGQLCRGGKVDAELVGRTWYVDPESVKAHKQTRYRSSKAATKRELKSDVRQALKEQQSAERENFYTYQQRPKSASQVRYESDEAELFPALRKHSEKRTDDHDESVELPVELAGAEKLDVQTDEDQEYHFEAPKREKTKFFGTLKVTDFIADMPVEGTVEAAHSVPVQHASRSKQESESSPSKKTPTAKKRSAPTATDILQKKRKEQQQRPAPTDETPAVAMPVTVDAEAVSLPIKYQVITAAVVVGALLLATALVGLETTVTATAESVSTGYAFTAKNLSALIYFVK